MTALAVNRYNRWLRDRVARPGPSYDIMMDHAFETPYIWFVENDHNRAQDGMNLRRQFEFETSIRLPELGPCRVLEFLVALAKRLNEETYDHQYPDQTTVWFWKLVSHLGLDEYHDNYDFNLIHRSIQYTFQKLNNREYYPDGTNGGLFPLKDPVEDQRGVEVWYQMMAYLSENM